MNVFETIEHLDHALIARIRQNEDILARVRSLEAGLRNLSDWVSDNHGCHVPNEYEGCLFCEEAHRQIRDVLAGGVNSE